MMALLNLLAAMALLLWGSRHMDRGLRAVMQPWTETLLPHAGRGRHAAFGLGFVAGLVRPTACDAAAAELPPARDFALLLGAGFGGAVAMLLLAHAPPWSFHALTIAGVAATLLAAPPRLRHAGQALVGAGLVLLALRILSSASAEASPVLGAAIAQGLEHDPLLAVTVGALLAAALRSVFPAMLLLGATWTAWLQPQAAVAVLLGIHLGAAAIACVHHRADAAAQRLALAQLLAALAVTGASLLLRVDLAQLLAPATAEALLLVNAVVTGLAALSLVQLAGPLTRWMQRRLPTPPAPGAARLPAGDLETPSLALAAAVREVMRMADLVDRMLRLAGDVFAANDEVAAHAIRDAEQRVNVMYRALKHYMAQIPRRPLTADEQWRWEEILTFLIAAEQVGDRVDRMLVDLEAKKLAPRLAYPGPAQAEVMALHGQLTRNLRLAASVCLERREAAAVELAASKNRFRHMEASFRAAHLARLVAGEPASVAISSLHLNLLAGFVDMNDQLCAFARTFLELRAARAAPLEALT